MGRAGATEGRIGSDNNRDCGRTRESQEGFPGGLALAQEGRRGHWRAKPLAAGPRQVEGTRPGAPSRLRPSPGGQALPQWSPDHRRALSLWVARAPHLEKELEENDLPSLGDRPGA